MYIETADPSGSWLYDFKEGLFGQIVSSNNSLIGDKQNGLVWMKMCDLRSTTTSESLPKGQLGLMLCNGVNSNCLRRRNGSSRADCDEMVTPGMEGQCFGCMLEVDHNSYSSVSLNC